jgi:Predicted aminopeptidases
MPDEAVIFCTHYDHIGVKKTIGRDSIFNGANDNASGTTAMLSLAKYFAAKNDNERTIIFCAFAGEELGVIGSSVFADKIIPNQIKGVINIEMIGKCRGTNSFFLTGSEYSNIEKILKKNLRNSKIKILNEPDQIQMLFERSDNYPFALKGIPAHTIMCSDESDYCYHKSCDEVNRIDFKNMTKIIKAIAIGVETIINGKDTPTRINVRDIRQN